MTVLSLRWLGRLIGLITVAAAAVMFPASAAFAGNGDDLGQTPSVLSWIKLKDSHGISMWNSEMSIDRGSVPFAADKMFWSSLTDMAWGAYRAGVAGSLWFLDWVLSFEWLSFAASPLIFSGDALQSVLDRVGAVPTLLSVTAAVGGLLIMRGRLATGIWEIGISMVIAALATGVFAQPVRMVAGDNGLIMKTHTAAFELASELATGDSKGKDAAELRKAQTGQLVDTCVRQPTQIINFGQVIDGGKCEAAYNKVIKGGPYGTESDIRDKIGDCDDSMGEYAKNPTVAMTMSSVVFMPAAILVLFLGILIGGAVILAGCNAVFQALKSIVTMVFGLLPGGGRGSLMVTVADFLVSLGIVVYSTVFLAVFLQVLQAAFASNPTMPAAQRFVIVDILMVVGLLIYVRQRRRLKRSSQNLAEALSKRPGGAPSPIPAKVSSSLPANAASAVRAASSLAQLAAARKIGQGAAPNRPAVTPAAVPPAAGDSQVTNRPSPTPVPSPTPALEHEKRKALMPADHTGLERVKARKTTGAAKTLGRAGAAIALSAATGGTSTVAVVAAKTAVRGSAIKTGRRVALATKLANSAATSSPGRAATAARSTGPAPTVAATRRPADARPPQQYDKVIKDGAVLLVPKGSAVSTPHAVRRSRRSK